MSFPGGKEASGVYQTIINQIPPHSTYIEAFAGGGAILRLKKPSAASIVIDIDPRVTSNLTLLPLPCLTVICADAISYLKKYRWKGTEFVYCDPPYLMETRLSKRRIYPFEFSTPDQHLELLSLLKSIPAMVMISSYWSELYFDTLPGWRFITYPASTRSTFKVKEYLWMNYSEPLNLHDYRYLGKDFREREKIKRQQRRWKSRLEKMDPLERAAILLAMGDLWTIPPEKHMGSGTPLLKKRYRPRPAAPKKEIYDRSPSGTSSPNP